MAEAKATDEAEDEQHGEARGDELPEQLRSHEGRREFFREAGQRLESEDGRQLLTVGQESVTESALSTEPRDSEPRDDTPPDHAPADPEPRGSEPTGRPGQGAGYVFDAERIAARVQGREGWLRDARRQLEADRWQRPEAVARSRRERLLIAAERLEAELEGDRLGNEAYEQYRAAGRMRNGRRFGGPPKPYVPPDVPAGKVNVSDPDSRYMKTRDGYVQGYIAQAVVTEAQIVLAAEITTMTVDWSQLDPMVTAALGELERTGVKSRPEVALADTQYGNEEHMDEVIANKHIQVC